MKKMVWNGNELVFDDKPKQGVAGIAPDQPDSLGKEIALAYNTYFTPSNSDYEAALRVEKEYDLYIINGGTLEYLPWLKERLHSAEKVPNVS